MKTIPTNLASTLSQTTGSSPMILLYIYWGTGTKIYSSIPRTGCDTCLIDIDSIVSMTREDNMGEVSSVKITLDDTSGEVKKKYDFCVAEGTICEIYQTDQEIEDKLLLFKGKMAGDIIWEEGTRLFSFDVESISADSEQVGYYLQSNDIAEMLPEAVGKFIPLSFGYVKKVPGLKVVSPRFSTLVKSEYFYENVYQVNTNALTKNVSSFTVSDLSVFPDGNFIVDVYHPLTDNLEDQINKYRIRFRVAKTATALAISASNIISYGPTKNIAIYTNIPIGPREDVTEGEHVVWITGDYDLVDMWVRYGAYINKVIKQDGNMLTFKAAWPTELASGSFTEACYSPPTRWMTPSTTFPTCYDLVHDVTRSSSLIDPNTEKFYDDYEFLSFSRVKTTGNKTQHLFNLMLGKDEYGNSKSTTDTVSNVYYEKDNVLTLIPKSGYSVTYPTIGGQRVSSLILKQDVTSTVYVTFQSSNVPDGNTAKVIRSLIYNFTDLAIDPISFARTAELVAERPSRFMLSSGGAVLTLCGEIAWQACCAFYVRGGTAYLVYLLERQPSGEVFDVNNLMFKSLKLTSTSTEDIFTRLIASWVSNYYDKEEDIIVANNIKTFGLKERDYDYYSYTTKEFIEFSLAFWLNKLSNSWRKVLFTSFIETLKVDVFDIINFVWDKYISTGVITKSAYNPKTNLIDYEIDLAILAGGTTTGQPDDPIIVQPPTSSESGPGPGPEPEPEPDEDPISGLKVNFYNVRDYAHQSTGDSLTTLHTNINAFEVKQQIYANSCMTYDGDPYNFFPGSIYERYGIANIFPYCREGNQYKESPFELIFAFGEDPGYEGAYDVYGKPFKAYSVAAYLEDDIKNQGVSEMVDPRMFTLAEYRANIGKFRVQHQIPDGDYLWWRHIYTHTADSRFYGFFADYEFLEDWEAKLSEPWVVRTQFWGGTGWSDTGWSEPFWYENIPASNYDLKPRKYSGPPNYDTVIKVGLDSDYIPEGVMLDVASEATRNLRRISRLGIGFEQILQTDNVKIKFKRLSETTQFKVLYSHTKPTTWADVLTYDELDYVWEEGLTQTLQIPTDLQISPLYVFFVTTEDFENDFEPHTNVILYDFEVWYNDSKITTTPQPKTTPTTIKYLVRNSYPIATFANGLPPFTPVQKGDKVKSYKNYGEHTMVLLPQVSGLDPARMYVLDEVGLPPIDGASDGFGWAYDPLDGAVVCRKDPEVEVSEDMTLGTEARVNYLEADEVTNGRYFTVLSPIDDDVCRVYVNPNQFYYRGESPEHYGTLGEVVLANGFSSTLKARTVVYCDRGLENISISSTDTVPGYLCQPIGDSDPQPKYVFVVGDADLQPKPTIGQSNQWWYTVGTGYKVGYHEDGYSVKVRYEGDNSYYARKGDKLFATRSSYLQKDDGKPHKAAYLVVEEVGYTTCLVELLDQNTANKQLKIFTINKIWSDGALPIRVRLVDGNGRLLLRESTDVTISVSGRLIRKSLNTDPVGSIAYTAEEIMEVDYPCRLTNWTDEDGRIVYVDTTGLPSGRVLTITAKAENLTATAKTVFEVNEDEMRYEDPQYYDDTSIFCATDGTYLLGKPFYSEELQYMLDEQLIQEEYPAFWRRIFYHTGTEFAYKYQRYESMWLDPADPDIDSGDSLPVTADPTDYNTTKALSVQNGYALLDWMK